MGTHSRTPHSHRFRDAMLHARYVRRAAIRCLRRWADHTLRSRHALVSSRVALRLRRHLLLRRGIPRWAARAHDEAEQRGWQQAAAALRRRHLLVRTWQGLAEYRVGRLRAHRQNAAADALHVRVQLRQAIRRWARNAAEQHHVQALDRVGAAHFRAVAARRAILQWRQYVPVGARRAGWCGVM